VSNRLITLAHPRILTSAAAILALMAAVGNGQPAYAATITVNTTMDELNSDGDCSLREAITAANTDAAVDACPAGSGADTITVPAGTYTLSIAGVDEDDSATGDLDVTDDLTINGAGAGSTVIDGGALDRVFHIQSGVSLEMSGVAVQNGSANIGGGIFNDTGGTLTLADVTVSGNTAASFGGGVDNSGTATLTNVTLSGNTANYGGGVDNYNGTATLINSTISGNTATAAGGGIFTDGGTATLTNSTVSGNTANYGGGIFNLNTATLTNVTVSGNTASSSSGGGIYNAGGTATLTLTDSTVSGNSAEFGGGGGIRNSGGTATLTNSTVNGNTADFGGGIFNLDTATLTNVTVSGNTATNCGGGIHNEGGTATLANVTVSGNAAIQRGGGICNYLATATLINSTVSGNTAINEGGGIYNSGPATLTLTNGTVAGNGAGLGGGIYNGIGDVYLTNTIVADSLSGGGCSGPGLITSQGHNLASDGSCGLTGTGDLPNADPVLGPLANNGGPTKTHALLPGSPAIDAGAACPATDQRGVTRPQGGACDIGAYELTKQGDVDCNGSANSVDALKLLRHVAGLSVSQQPGCPPIGTGDPVFGDVDCNGTANSVDALKVLRYVAGLSVAQTEPCPDIGTTTG